MYDKRRDIEYSHEKSCDAPCDHVKRDSIMFKYDITSYDVFKRLNKAQDAKTNGRGKKGSRPDAWNNYPEGARNIITAERKKHLGELRRATKGFRLLRKQRK